MWRIGAVLLLVSLAAVVALTRGPAPESSTASSHREAPLISEDPAADNTDVYAFRSPDRPNTVTIIATYVPLQEPAGGPNFAQFSENARYWIKVDNDGDGDDDVGYRFTFRTHTRNPHSFLYNTGPIDTLTDPDWNRPQVYTVKRFGQGGTEVLGRNLPVAPANIGPRSTPNYGALMDAAVSSLPHGATVYAGQADDPFFVDLGSIFDLGGLRPFNAAHVLPLDPEDGVDGVGGYNVHAIAIQVPIDQLTRDRRMPTGANDPQATIGVYATAERPRISVHRGNRIEAHGGFRQVSRLGNPLVNEVIIPVGLKDRWNAREPEDDARFLAKYRSPELARLVNLLYPSLPDTPTTARDDLVAVLLTGVPGLNFTGETKADLLRLNTGVAPTAQVGDGDRLGVLAGDLAGFPNGRRLEDDVTDIALRAVACGYGDVLEDLLGLCNLSPNNQIGDGVDTNDRSFKVTFPYLGTPHQGYEHVHHSAVGGP